MNTYSITQFAQRISVSVKTLQRWDSNSNFDFTVDSRLLMEADFA
jgi:DNA-binding transcriptional regulator YiaG